MGEINEVEEEKHKENEDKLWHGNNKKLFKYLYFVMHNLRWYRKEIYITIEMLFVVSARNWVIETTTKISKIWYYY
jgi:hypothetical protein